MPSLNPTSYKWLRTGEEVFPAMLAAIDAAQDCVRLESYIFADDELGRRFLDTLVRAQQRRVNVRVLVDALGSLSLHASFWQPLLAAGGEVQWFNPTWPKRFGFRNHRKLLVCDAAMAFVGGFNISVEYQGDGVTSGWCDLGLQVCGPLVLELATAFDDMFARALLPRGPFQRLRRSGGNRAAIRPEGQLLLSGPERGRNPIKRFLRRDLLHAKTVRIIAAYFLPTWRLRRDLIRLARSGCRVQLMLPAKSDVLLSQLACRSLYRRFLKAGIEIYEYQPQILHAKLILVDDIVYVGSSNLDPRSLYINYELMLRFENPELADGARLVFEEKLAHCEQIQLEGWRRSRTWWKKLQQRWAYFILVRVDPVIARWNY